MEGMGKQPQEQQVKNKKMGDIEEMGNSCKSCKHDPEKQKNAHRNAMG